MRLKYLTVFLLLFGILNSSEVCLFIPPVGWEVASPETLAPRVRVAFLGRPSGGFSPSVNLAVEEVDISLETYVQEVRKIHNRDPNSVWKDLGKFSTPLGEGRLTQLESPTKQGQARLIQLIVIKDRMAYILTAAALKEEFSKYYQTFRKVLNSLQLSSNLIESYSETAERPLLNELIQNLEKTLTSSLKEGVEAEAVLASESFQTLFWKPFEKKIINDFTKMGPYWQIILLQQTRAKLLTQRLK